MLADSIALNSAQDLLLLSNNQHSWFIKRKGMLIPPDIQPVTQHEAIATPRSPALFATVGAPSGVAELRVIGLTTSVSGDTMGEVATVITSLPAEVRFFNVDRAMNTYFVRPTLDNDALDIWRVLPDGTTAGGAHILLGTCGFSWRRFYVDQAGAVWTMCASAQGVTITRYAPQDPDGQPLPDAAQEAAEVAWRPGARLDAA